MADQIPVQSRARRGALGTVRRFLPAVEVAFGLLLIYALTIAESRIVVEVWLKTALRGAGAYVALLRVDGAATTWLAAVAIGRLALAVFPFLVLMRCVPRYRLVWMVPVAAMLVMVSSPVSLAACKTPLRWLLLVAVSGIAAALCRQRFCAWVVVLPFLPLWEAAPSHSLAPARTADPAYREQLLADCQQRAGVRPTNLVADRLMPYYGITAIDDDLLLLTGEGNNDGDMHTYGVGRRVGSWWMRRAADGGFQFEAPSEATGNLWRGCALDETAWMARSNRIVGTRRLLDSGMAERLRVLDIPAGEMDFSQTACDPQRGRVYVSEAYNGGVWEVAPDDGQPRRHQIGGAGLWPKRRFDGRLILTDTASLVVFDPEQDRIIERIPAALVSISSDVCGVDGSVVVADMTGRLRIFTLDDQGRYQFSWGVSTFAPRRVAFSRDCSRIGATSADDYRVFLVDVKERRIADVFDAGPALREIVATGPRELSITDTCSMTTYRW